MFVPDDDTIPDDENLYHFIGSGEWVPELDGTVRVSSGVFRTPGGTPNDVVSMNRGSIWPLETQVALTPPGRGLFSITAGQLRSVPEQANPIDIVPAPLIMDPYLQIPNPAHANLSRAMKKSEAKKASRIASQQIHILPRKL